MGSRNIFRRRVVRHARIRLNPHLLRRVRLLRLVSGTDDATTEDPTRHLAIGSLGGLAPSLRSSAGKLCPGSARSSRNHTRARPSGRNRRPACAHGREPKEAPKFETKPYVPPRLFVFCIIYFKKTSEVHGTEQNQGVCLSYELKKDGARKNLGWVFNI